MICLDMHLICVSMHFSYFNLYLNILTHCSYDDSCLASGSPLLCTSLCILCMSNMYLVHYNIACLVGHFFRVPHCVFCVSIRCI